MTMNIHTVAALILGLVLLGGCATAKKQQEQRVDGDEDPFALVEMADRAYKREQWLDAAYYYKMLTRRVPNDAYAWMRLGNVYIRQQKFEAAVHALRNSLQRNGNQPKAYFNLGTAYMLLARQALQQAQTILPTEDAAQALIATKIEALDGQIFTPLADTPPASGGLIEQAGPPERPAVE